MNSQVYDKAYQFAIRIVNAYKHLCKEKKEFVLSKQLLRSGTTSVSSYQLPVTMKSLVTVNYIIKYYER